jgi:CSLREA domain-containing protein
MRTLSTSTIARSHAWPQNYWLAAGLAFVLAGLSMTRPAHASGTIQVTTLTDNDVADSQCSLREAIISQAGSTSYHGCVNSGNSADAIQLPAGTIALTSTLPNLSAGVTITGLGYAASFINGQRTSGIGGLNITATSSPVYQFVEVSDVTLMNFYNNAFNVSAGSIGYLTSAKIINSGNSLVGGGCVNNAGNVTIAFSQLELCQGFTAGALQNTGTAELVASTVLKGTSEHSTIVNDGTMMVEESTIAANKVGVGGAAFLNNGTLSIENSTMAYNIASEPNGSESNALYNAGGTIDISSSVIFNTQSGVDCVGTITSDGFNETVIGRGCTFSNVGDRTTLNPQLQPITVAESGFTNLPRAAGGVGRVYVPAASSDLWNANTGGFCGNNDQRGLQSNSDYFGNSTCDIGSVQHLAVLLIVGNTNLSAGDTIIKAQLQTLGFLVTVVRDGASSAASANGMRLVVISGSVAPGNVTTKFRDVSAGVLVLHPGLFANMMMTTTKNQGSANNTKTNLLAGTIASDIGLQQTQTTTTASSPYAWGTPGVNAVVHAQSTGVSAQKQLFEYYPFNPMVNNYSVPNERVGMFATDATVPKLNAVGLQLLQEAALRAGVGVFFD